MKNWVYFLGAIAGLFLSTIVMCRIDILAISPGHYLTEEGKKARAELQESQKPQESQDSKESQKPQESQDSKESQKPQESQDSKESQKPQESQNLQDSQEPLEESPYASIDSSEEWMNSLAWGEKDWQVRNVLIQYGSKPESAQSGTSEFVYSDYGDCVVITEYTGKDAVVIVPSVFRGKVVTEIKSYAFQNNLFLEEVILPDTLMKIGDCAFRDCKALKTVTIGSGTTTIGGSAFSGCENLKTVTKAETEEINFPLQFIEGGAFRYCYALETIDLSRAIRIESYAFSECNALRKVSLERIVYIDDHSFQDCNSLESIFLSSRLEDLRDCSFRGCTQLRDVTFEEGGTNPLKIGESVLDGSVVEELVLPGRCEKLGYASFSDCGSLRSFTLQDSGKNEATQSIYAFTFGGDQMLTEVYLPRTVGWMDSFAGIALSNPEVVLYAPEGSYAQQYASENNITWAPWD